MGDVGAGRKEGGEIVTGMYCMREKKFKRWFQCPMVSVLKLPN